MSYSGSPVISFIATRHRASTRLSALEVRVTKTAPWQVCRKVRVTRLTGGVPLEGLSTP